MNNFPSNKTVIKNMCIFRSVTIKKIAHILIPKDVYGLSKKLLFHYQLFDHNIKLVIVSGPMS